MNNQNFDGSNSTARKASQKKKEKKPFSIIPTYGVITAQEILRTDYPVLFEISREEVEREDMRRITNQIIECRQAGAAASGRLTITISGYFSDPRELYEVPEVRKFVKRLVEEIPELFFYLSMSHKWLLFSLINVAVVEIKNGKTKTAILPSEDASILLEQLMAAANRYRQSLVFQSSTI